MKIKISELNPLERLVNFSKIIIAESKQPSFWNKFIGKEKPLTSPPPQAKGER